MEQSEQGPSRRNVITGLAAAGLGVPLIAACGSTVATGTTPGPQAAGGGTSSQTPLVKESDVPVDSGVILSQAVVTQPSPGTFKAFSPVCPHAGCTVAQITGKTIICPCHGSQFSIIDGSVIQGPAPTGLTPIDITTKGGEVFAR